MKKPALRSRLKIGRGAVSSAIDRSLKIFLIQDVFMPLRMIFDNVALPFPNKT